MVSRLATYDVSSPVRSRTGRGSRVPPNFASLGPWHPLDRAAGPACRAPTRLRGVLEAFYTTLLVVIFVLVAWFAVYTVYKLFKGQS